MSDYPIEYQKPILIENLNIIEKNAITWEVNDFKNGREIKYKNRIEKQSDCISINTETFVDGKIKNKDLIYIPSELVDFDKIIRKYEMDKHR